MKKILLLPTLLILSNIFAQTDDAHRQLVQNERRAAAAKMHINSQATTDNYDVVFHRLVFTPDMNQDFISGIVTTYYKPTTDINNIEFDLMDQLNVQSVTQRGNNLAFTHSNNTLHIQFPTTAHTNVLDSLTINYSGTPPDSGFDSYVTTDHNGTPIVWTLSEPYGARDWWPCKQALNDKIDSLEVKLIYPRYINGQEMKGVSNGIKTSDLIISNSSTGEEYKETTWHSNYPIATYLVAFAITNYQKQTLNVGVSQAFPIDNFYYPEFASTYQAQAPTIIPVMNYYENSFGLYPFRNEKYGQAQFGWGGGMEHQTMTFVVNFSRGLTAHELAHQWFGDAITCGSWHDIWLNEGFATYSEGLTRKQLDGNAAFVTWKGNTINTITSQPNGSVYVNDISNVNRIFSWRLSYSKGAMVLNMLRLKMGDADFFQGLKNYVTQKSFGYAATADFKNVMATTSNQNLDEFFNDWIFGEGYPTYNIDIVRSGTHRYQITVNQTTSDASVPFFEMPLPFRFTNASGQTFDVLLDNTQNGQVFVVDTGMDATQVQFDAENDIVKGNTVLNTNLSVSTFEANKFVVYPNPATDFIRLNNKNNLQIDALSLFDLEGKLVAKSQTNRTLINTKNIANGTYFVHIVSGKKTYINKIIIRH